MFPILPVYAAGLALGGYATGKLVEYGVSYARALGEWQSPSKPVPRRNVKKKKKPKAAATQATAPKNVRRTAVQVAADAETRKVTITDTKPVKVGQGKPSFSAQLATVKPAQTE